MTAPPLPAPRTSARTDTGLFLVGQVLLMFAALFWMPFGARESTGVSNVLPALHPALLETPTTIASAQSDDGARDRTPLGAAVAIVATACLALVARRRPTATLRPRRALLPARDPCRRHHGCRAPPVLR